jgi:bromodomain-containing factor 1
MKLYALVVRGSRKPARPRSSAPKKTGRKATGGASRKFMNEDEEAERIRRMEAQLQSFDSGRGAQPAYGFEEEADDSSDEESSDDE